MPHGIDRRTFVSPEPEPERPRIRPLQIICLVGFFVSTLIALLAYEEPSLRLLTLGMGFVVVLLGNTLWRGLRTGKLVYRGTLIDGVREPLAYFGMTLFYLVMLGLMIYYGVELWRIEM